MNCWRSVVTMPTFTKNSCWKKSWRANERFPRRRETWQAVRHPAHPPADEIPGPVSLAGDFRDYHEPGDHLHGHSRPLPVRPRNRQVRDARDETRDRLPHGRRGTYVHCDSLSRIDHGQFRTAIFADAHHAVGGPADDV